MFIEKLKISGYKIFSNSEEIHFQRGMNLLVGENGCGKSSIIDALRLLLIDDSSGRNKISDSDFFKGYEETSTPSDVITCNISFSGLSEQERIAFLPWYYDKDHISLNLIVENRTNNYGRYKKIIWGGHSKASIFENELFDLIKCIYLPPLRDAETSLESGRNSRLSKLLLKLTDVDLANGTTRHPLEVKVNDFNKELATDETIVEVDNAISEKLSDALGLVFSQSTSIQFSPIDLRRIVENLRLLFFPIFKSDTPKELFRSLEENSLGYNNIIYLATVLAELKYIDKNHEYLNLLLIEEPEAHLHPQLQIKLLKYVEKLTKDQDNIQVIITTHSPVITSSVSLDSIIHIERNENEFSATSLFEMEIPPNTKDFLERWLDITKSTLLFSKGIIFVEGIAEGILIPVISRLYLQSIHQEYPTFPTSLEDAGISVINMNGIYFDYFMYLFTNITDEDGNKKIPIKCSGITDKDPGKDIFPTEEEIYEGKNPAIVLQEKILATNNCRIFVSPYKTLEYDVALTGENLKTLLKIESFNPRDVTLRKVLRELKETDDWSKIENLITKKRDAAKYILGTIDKGHFAQMLAFQLEKEEIKIVPPNYIIDAIDWVVRGTN